MPFDDLIRALFALVDRLPLPITLLCGPYYAPFIYSQHRYASTFQSAEALAKADLCRKEKTPSAHQKRIEAVTAVLTAADLDPDIIN